MTDTYVEINISNMAHNARAIVEKYPEYKTFIGIVKGDAYGHGFGIVNALYENGVRYFAVSSMEEAEDFRKENTEAPLLCLEPVSLDRLDEAAKLNLTMAIPDMEYLDSLLSSDNGYPFKLHIQIDSGFNRLGFKDKNEVKQAADKIEKSIYNLEGVYQHYATAGIFDPYYDAQQSRFRELTSLLDLSKIPLVHLGSGIALMAHKKPDIATATRMGLMMYGYNISPDSYGSGLKDRLRSARDNYYQKKYHLSEVIRDVELELKPAMTMKCRILQLKDVKKGEHIGYGAAYTAENDIRIAILPVGYNNG
ncbi:MAG: alanine racemase, partial [Ruminococcus sp.]|nr:alanine racemase [Ruminococcus sp.]